MARRNPSAPSSALAPAAPLLSLLSLLLLLLGRSPRPARAESEFNFEVGRRIHERVTGFMGAPVTILELVARYRANSAFPRDMGAPDRDAFFRLNDALMGTYPQFQSVYYGLEDGTFAGHGFAKRIANYREPGHSGYEIGGDDDDDGDGAATDGTMQKHYEACVDSRTGESAPCAMKAGSKYTRCANDCALERCGDAGSRRNCTAVDGEEERLECEGNVKWCVSYDIEDVTEEDGRLGYVPRSTYCINSDGVPSQAAGEIAKVGTDDLGSCFYEDGATPVRRNITGDYAYCMGGETSTCGNTFDGAYAVRDYDPRDRGAA